MTVTEFARQYQIPHSVVYNASFRIPYEIRSKCDMDYPVDELMKATETELNGRISYHQEKVDKNKQYMKLLKEGTEPWVTSSASVLGANVRTRRCTSAQESTTGKSGLTTSAKDALKKRTGGKQDECLSVENTQSQPNKP